MTFFRKNGNSNNQWRDTKPTESAVIAPNVVLNVWLREDRFHWALSRVNPKDASSPYRTFRAENTGDVVKAMSAVASLFSNFAMLSDDVQQYNSQLADELEQVVSRMDSFAVSDSNGETTSILLSAGQ